MRLRELAVCAERKQKYDKTSKTHKELNITVGINRTNLIYQPSLHLLR